MINKINKLPESEFIKVFANIFENTRWIAEELYKQKPFGDFNELSSKMMNIFEERGPSRNCSRRIFRRWKKINSTT